MEQSRIWNFLKYLSYAIIAIFVVVLFVQFVELSKLNREKQSLNRELSTATQEYQNKQQLQSELDKNYSSYATDQAKEEYDMKNNNEEVIVAN